MRKYLHGLIYRMNISGKLMAAFTITLLLAFGVTMVMNASINQKLSEVEQVYTSNNQLNDISAVLGGIQSSMQEYLDTKSSDSLLSYYDSEQKFRGLTESLSGEITDEASDIMEKNIKGLSDRYLDLTNDAIEAKRARNISKYNSDSAAASKTYKYLYSYIFSLNNLQFEVNSGNYESLAAGLRRLQTVTTIMNAAMAGINLLFLGFFLRQILRPLNELAKSADLVAAGNFEVPELAVHNMDEVGVVTKAFNKMVVSIRQYMEQIKESIQKENHAKERELLMEASLKEAQLKFYQAQIHPHFLFNMLNAGVQMAMMEEAENTSAFIQHMSEFFRYNLKSSDADVSLEEEIELIENYIYIMNVRFSNEIHYSSDIRCDTAEVRVPSMILQPVVENAIRHGIRGIEREGHIWLKAEEEEQYYQICIRDDGAGIEKERLKQIRSGRLKPSENKDDTNGIGLGNVMERLNLYFHKEGLLTIHSQGKGSGTEIRIHIPKSG